MTNIKKELQEIAKDSNDEMTELEKYVADYILEHVGNYGEGKTENKDFESWLNDLNQGGCQSGMISALIYYEDTTKFYDKYADDIWELLGNEAENSGLTVFEILPKLDEAMKAGETQFKNLLAWFAFEMTANNLLNSRLGGE